MDYLNTFLQKMYMTLLNPIHRHVTGKIPERSRNVLIWLSFVAFFFYFAVFRSNEYYQLILEKIGIAQNIGSILLFFIAVMSINGELRPIKYNKIVSVPYTFFGAGFIITSFIHPIGEGYLNFGIMLLLIYPCLHFVWNNRRDYETLFDIIAASCISIGLFYLVRFELSILLGETTESVERQAGGMYNANFLAFLGTSVACCSLYLWYRCFRKELKMRHAVALTCIVSFAGGCSLIIVGESRSPIIIIATSLIALLIFIISSSVSNGNNRLGKIKARTILAITVCAMLAGLYYLSTTSDGSFVERFSLKGKTVDQFASGRIRLWMSYASQLNLTGHDMDNVDWDSLTMGINTRHAHNSFLDFSYRCGVIEGVIFLIFHIVVGIMTLTILFGKKKHRSYELFIIISVIHFTVHALIDIATIPMGSYGPFFFYIAIAPLFVDWRRTK